MIVTSDGNELVSCGIVSECLSTERPLLYIFFILPIYSELRFRVAVNTTFSEAAAVSLWHRILTQTQTNSRSLS